MYVCACLCVGGDHIAPRHVMHEKVWWCACVCGGGGGFGHFIYYPKSMIGTFAQLVYSSYNTAYIANSNPQSKKGDHHLILHKREPLKYHYMIHNTQHQ